MASLRSMKTRATATTTKKDMCATIPFEWNEARQTLTIGKRSGKFPGMLNERTFHVVFVSPGHGVGMDSETQSDAVVHYTGRRLLWTAKQSKFPIKQ